MSSRANGTLSRGPKTPDGKRKSSRNAVRHGLLSKIVVTQNESRHGFDLVFGDHFNTFEPTNGVELGFTETMAASSWRLRRLWALENKLMNDAIQAVDSPDELTQLATAYTQLVETPRHTLLHRYDTSLDRTYQRALRNMLLLRKKVPLPNEPSL
jgi:hypothetical protein